MKKKELMQNYNKIALEYGLYRRRVWEPLKDFLKNKKETILDLGCGECPLARDYSNKFIGLDFSIELLKKSYCKDKICADIEHIPIKANSFKYITSIAVIHHLNNEKSRLNFLKEIKRILKPGGEAFITSIVYRERAEKIYGKDYNLPYGKYPRYYHFFTKEELQDLIKKAGLTIKQYKIDEKNQYIIIKNNA
jgi:ubiquinone/menaquinone biosynthesis C-methylase UbiE